MGRFEKVLVNDSGIDVRESGYYSTPKFVADYIADQILHLNPNGKKVLDPATGKEELLEKMFKAGKLIDSYDIIEYGDIKYSDFHKQDFIEFYIEKKISLFLSENIDLEYDYYISNPPYNCHEIDYIKNNKDKLNRIFNGIGVHNMYSLFLSAIIDCAKDGALIGVIVSDSFLTATMHSALRQQILDYCSIHQLILCPNDLFLSQKADVRTCILILQKGKKHQNKIEISNRPKSTNELKNILSRKQFIKIEFDSLVLGNKKNLNQFVIDVRPEIISLFKNKKVGELFECVTGISTGNDKKYLSKVKKEKFEIPFYKNPGSRKFTTQPDAYIVNDFLEESKLVRDFMVRNKGLIFKEGITCSSMGLPFSACYLPEYSAFGVNANIFTPKKDLFWMISYLNSHLVTYIVRGILIRSNMVTSGYISQIPIIDFTEEEKSELSRITENVINKMLNVEKAISEINNIIYLNLNFDASIVEKIADFALNLSKRV